ncbi:hypothetical protein ZTR_01016 [Talaromyces verruculosus]|nr:hypothetical protein ZTR_01016 [Talaromyces verruculosus]
MANSRGPIQARSAWLLQFFCLIFISTTAQAVSLDPHVLSVCQQFKSLYGNLTFLTNQTQYKALADENWSQTAWAEPSCILQPGNTPQVQNILRILTAQQIPFAIRSGGHLPSPLGANINRGVLIDLSSLKTLDYDAANEVVSIGSGLRWQAVYEGLAPYGRTAVGGRLLDVGVGGLLLGSGLSYLSDLYGLACDNVVNFDVVLASGERVNANATSNSDLFWALKGGANNFGIVTTFTVRTYPIGDVWGGIKVYDLEYLPEVLAALNTYQSVENKDPYANLMVQAATTNTSIGVLLNLVYLKPMANPAAFDPFYGIPTLEDTTVIQSFVDFLSGAVMPDIPRWDWYATSFKPTASLYSQIADIVTTAPEVNELISVNAATLVVGIQPISTSLIAAGHAAGSNALGLEAVNQTWLVLDIGWEKWTDDAKAHNLTRSLQNRIEKATVEAGQYVEYIFMNDASWDQEVIAHYGHESVERLKAVRDKYDPGEIFQRLVKGGFKLG